MEVAKPKVYLAVQISAATVKFAMHLPAELEHVSHQRLLEPPVHQKSQLLQVVLGALHLVGFVSKPL